MTRSAAEGLPVPRRYWAMLTLCLGVALSTLDGAIANIALPTIAHDLHAAPAATVWVVNAYQLAVVATILPFSAIGESLGYGRVYLAGILMFTLGSLGCAFSASLPMLVGFRVLQGASGAALVSVSAALLRHVLPKETLGRGMSIYTLTVALALSAGPTIAATILEVASWKWLFAINVPLGLVAVTIGLKALPKGRRMSRPFDYGGALLNALALGLLVIGVEELRSGATRWIAAGEIVAAVLIGAVLIRQQLTKPTPLVPVDLMRIPMFALSTATSACCYTAQTIAFVALPFYFQDMLGRGQVETGLLITPWPAVVVGIAPLAGRLSDRYPAGILSSIGLVVMTLGLVLLMLLPAHPSDLDIAWRMVLAGCGFGFFQTPNNRAILMSAPIERSGGASGGLATARLLGQSLGAALVAVILGILSVAGIWVALLIGAGFTIVAAVASSSRNFTAGASI